MIWPFLETTDSYHEPRESSEDGDVMMVKIWRNVDGDLKLTDQKPVARTEFDKMQNDNDFSSLVSAWLNNFYNKQDSI